MCQQIIAWQITIGAVVLCVAVAMWIAFRFAVRSIFRAVDNGREPVVQVALTLVTGISAVGFSVATIIHGAGAIKAIVAPKLFLLEYIADLIK